MEVIDTELFFDILLAALAVFGLWCVMRLATEAALGEQQICLCVKVTNRQDEQRLDALLEQARLMLSYRRRSGLMVLYERSLTEQGSIPEWVLALARRYGARCAVVDTCEGEDEKI